MRLSNPHSKGSPAHAATFPVSEVLSDTGSEGPQDSSRIGEPPPRQPIYRDYLLIQLAVLVFFLDQFSKYLVREFLPLYHSWPIEGFFRITHTFNTGSIFGLFQGHNPAFILVSFLGVAVLMLIYRSQRFPTGLLRLSLGLQLGGAFGNLIDRVRLGHVTDWIDVSVWPVFNVADACIVTGLVVLAWLFLMSERKHGSDPSDQEAYDFCPICDGQMRALPSAFNGDESWRCSSCGVRERRLHIAPVIHHPVTETPPSQEDAGPTHFAAHVPCDGATGSHSVPADPPVSDEEKLVRPGPPEEEGRPDSSPA